jgi:hypothetical protein
LNTLHSVCIPTGLSGAWDGEVTAYRGNIDWPVYSRERRRRRRRKRKRRRNNYVDGGGSVDDGGRDIVIDHDGVIQYVMQKATSCIHLEHFIYLYLILETLKLSV